MIISFNAPVTGINTLLSKKFAWKINDLSTEILLDPVLNYTEYTEYYLSAIFGRFVHSVTYRNTRTLSTKYGTEQFLTGISFVPLLACTLSTKYGRQWFWSTFGAIVFLLWR